MRRISLIMLLLATTLMGDIITVTAEGSYEMSPADTNESAINVSVSLAKVNAIEKIGTAVQSSMTYTQSSDGSLVSRQDARVYSAALMRSRVIDTTFIGNRCKTTIEATIDDSKLEEYLSDTPETKTALSRLSEQYDDMVMQIAHLNDKMATIGLHYRIDTGQDGMIDTLDDIKGQRDQKLLRFDLLRKDMFTAAHISSSSVSDALKANRIRELDDKATVDALLRYIRDHTTLRQERISIATDVSGNGQNVLVAFSWRVPWSSAETKTLSDTITMEYRDRYRKEDIYLKGNRALADKYLDGHKVFIAVSALGRTIKYPISSLERYGQEFMLQTHHLDGSQVLFRGLSEEELKDGFDVELSIVIEEDVKKSA